MDTTKRAEFSRKFEMDIPDVADDNRTLGDMVAVVFIVAY